MAEAFAAEFLMNKLLSYGSTCGHILDQFIKPFEP